MTWRWDQSAGHLMLGAKSVSRGYSGRARGKNNPALQGVRGVGPIPRGRYKIGAPYNSKNVGPYTLPLDAIDAKPGDDIHQETGRSAFRIHGDSIRAPGTASKGCIILPRAIRQQIWASGIREIEVIE
jgi:hypothetical protein